MKILIVDDSEAKGSALKQCLAECDASATIISVTNAQDGFRAILKGGINLVLLDVLIPLKEGETPSEESSIWFVREVHRKVKDPLPLIVGSTQYLDSLAKVEVLFREYLWSIVYVGVGEISWKRQIGYAVRFSRTTAMNAKLASQTTEPVDAAIITALRIPEFNEVVYALGGGEQMLLTETNESWLRCVLTLNGGRQLNIVAACADEMGMCSMSALVTRLCIACKPKKLILVGIMGGNPERVAMSDIVMVEETWDCRAGKITENGFQPDIKGQRCDFKLANMVRAVITEDSLQELWKSWKGEKPNQFPRLHCGAVACSPAVIADGKIFADLEMQKRKVLGVEMEAYGCYDAAHRLGDIRPAAICLKSVCDLGDKDKADKYQRFAAFMSASLAVRLLNDSRFHDT